MIYDQSRSADTFPLYTDGTVPEIEGIDQSNANFSGIHSLLLCEKYM